MTLGPTVALFPEASFGAALNCVGIAQELRRLGATAVFICHPGFTGVFNEYGFKEYHLPAGPQNSAQSIEDYWQSFITTHLPHFNLTPFDQLPTYVAPTWDAIVSTAEAADEGLRAVLERIKPDMILLDNVIMFPAIANAGCPWVRVVSCTETEIPDPNVPPYLSGLPPEDAKACNRFKAAYLKQTAAPHRRYNEFRKTHGLPPLPAGSFLEASPTLNLMLAPSAIRYQRALPLPEDRYVFLEGCVRAEGHFAPPQMRVSHEPLVYMSFGSLGAIDTPLIARMIDVFASVPARFLINVGGFLEAYRHVPDNVSLGSWFPQPSVVARSDVFIHHGGNNSFCEALYHGVPSLVMPYCWDGHDNAQRAEATGLGKRLDRRDWGAQRLYDAVLGLLQDDAMRGRLSGVSKAMQAQPGTERAARAVLAALTRTVDAPLA
ncbi:MAG: glycosyltransferase [Albidovulum sp.]